jgi:hypothetical protein
VYKLKGGRQLVIFVQFLFNMGRFDVGGCVKLWVEGLCGLKNFFFCKFTLFTQNSQLKRKSYLRKKLKIQTKIGGNSGGRPNNYVSIF